MKANELKCTDLRIGNWIKYENRPFEVIEISPISLVVRKKIGDIFEMQHRALDVAQPIELTEEVLVKIGFEKDGNNYSLVCDDIEVGFYVDKFKQVLYIEVPREKRFYKNELRSYDVKYLHELQNTYYCLTGKELEVEL